MGRRSRLHRQAVIEGRVRSWRQAAGDLRRHVVRLAIPLLFNNMTQGDRPVESMQDDIAKAIVQAVPAACQAANVHRFHIKDITQDRQFLKVAEGLITGILAHAEDKFGMEDRKGTTWKLKKRRSRPRTGRWRFCGWDGWPIYITGCNDTQLYCSRRCYWAAYRTGEAPRRRRRRTGYEIEEAVLQAKARDLPDLAYAEAR